MYDSLIGQSLGRYNILEQLGEGGMATVYKAFDTRLETDVAVKVIRTDNLAPNVLARTRKRFEREAKALAKLTHPNIVKVIDYGEQDGRPYLVMEYLPGGTLKQAMGGKVIPWQEAVSLLCPIAQALEDAHKRGIVHRDVKPSNILITESGQPMLSDFGIAKILEAEETQELTATGAGVGTPEYMAPEQGLGQKADHHADIYALGIVLYEMVTGRKPFQADTPMAVVVKHINDPLPRPTRFVSGLPKNIERILLKALAKDPKNRYKSMGGMAAALEKSVSRVGETKPKKHKVERKSPKNTEKKTISLKWILGGVFGVVGLVTIYGAITWLASGGPALLFPTSTSTSTATLTIIGTPMASSTPEIIATNTPSITPTKGPLQVEITESPVDSIYPQPKAAISLENADQIQLLTSWRNRLDNEGLALGILSWINDIAFSPDGQLFAVASPRGVTLYRIPGFYAAESVKEMPLKKKPHF